MRVGGFFKELEGNGCRGIKFALGGLGRDGC